MAHQITDARQETVSIPRKFNPKWLVISLVVACVIGGSVGGYYLYDQVTSVAELPKPPVQPEVVAPATPSETPTPVQPETPMPVLEVAWEEIKLPPLEFGFDDIIGFSVEDGGKTISVYRVIGPADNGKATKYSLWKTTDGGKAWKELGEEILYPGQEKQLWLIPSERVWGGAGANLLQNEEEVVEQPLSPLVVYGAPWLASEDQNNIFVAACYFPFDDSLPYRQKMYWVYRLFLSTDNGKSWNQLNFPPRFTRFDRYPETPELTLLKEIIFEEPRDGVYGLVPVIEEIDIISSEDGTINLYMISGRGGFLRATIKSPN